MIRSAGVADLKALYELEILCFAERRFTTDHLLYILRNPRASTFVDEENAILGSLMVLEEGSVLRVLSIGVHPAYRRRGLGSRLMAVAENLARRFAAQEVRLEVSTNNSDAIAFYRALGYEVSKRLPRYYSWGEDAFAMTKPIAIQVRNA